VTEEEKFERVRAKLLRQIDAVDIEKCTTDQLETLIQCVRVVDSLTPKP
jgi:hypothetical protein